jgi:hypothetical protein
MGIAAAITPNIALSSYPSSTWWSTPPFGRTLIKQVIMGIPKWLRSSILSSSHQDISPTEDVFPYATSQTTTSLFLTATVGHKGGEMIRNCRIFSSSANATMESTPERPRQSRAEGLLWQVASGIMSATREKVERTDCPSSTLLPQSISSQPRQRHSSIMSLSIGKWFSSTRPSTAESSPLRTLPPPPEYPPPEYSSQTANSSTAHARDFEYWAELAGETSAEAVLEWVEGIFYPRCLGLVGVR